MRPRSHVAPDRNPQLAGFLPANNVAILEPFLESRAELLPARPRFIEPT